MPEVQLSTRREFLHRGMALIGVGTGVPSFLVQSAYALGGPKQVSQAPAGGSDDRVLVVLQLAGGNDGLNTLVPFLDDRYHAARPRLRLNPSEVLKINSELGLHPAATGLRALFDDGLMSIVQGVGYPNPNRSHFKSMDIWHTASPGGRSHQGWLGRYFDHECAGEDPCDPMRGLALMAEAPLALRGDASSPIALEDPDDLRLRRVGGAGRGSEAILRLNASTEQRRSGTRATALDFLRRTAMDARISAEQIRGTAGAASVGRRLPASSLGRSLRMIVRMIAAGAPTRVYYVSMGGFDTHSRQIDRHRRLMSEMGDALMGFVKELADTGDLDRTMIMTFSEFGRRVAENASGGTDHGAAAPMFVIGRVRAGVLGKNPDLGNLHRGDLAYTLDFRRVYATILRDWLGADPQPILGRRFAPLPIIRR